MLTSFIAITQSCQKSSEFYNKTTFSESVVQDPPGGAPTDTGPKTTDDNDPTIKITHTDPPLVEPNNPVPTPVEIPPEVIPPVFVPPQEVPPTEVITTNVPPEESTATPVVPIATPEVEIVVVTSTPIPEIIEVPVVDPIPEVIPTVEPPIIVITASPTPTVEPTQIYVAQDYVNHFELISPQNNQRLIFIIDTSGSMERELKVLEKELLLFADKLKDFIIRESAKSPHPINFSLNILTTNVTEALCGVDHAREFGLTKNLLMSNTDKFKSQLKEMFKKAIIKKNSYEAPLNALKCFGQRYEEELHSMTDTPVSVVVLSDEDDCSAYKLPVQNKKFDSRLIPIDALVDDVKDYFEFSELQKERLSFFIIADIKNKINKKIESTPVEANSGLPGARRLLEIGNVMSSTTYYDITKDNYTRPLNDIKEYSFGNKYQTVQIAESNIINESLKIFMNNQELPSGIWIYDESNSTIKIDVTEVAKIFGEAMLSSDLANRTMEVIYKK